ncbi:MAG TPA: PKD domain-containing protein [Gemmatimonadaceae bacterium]|jgi:PKD repeat protein
MKVLIAACAAVLLSACSDGTVQPLALSISATATPTSAAVGDTITFVADMQGTSLVRLGVAYGDGSTEGFDIPFGRTARNTFKHVYTAAGNYTATLTVAQSDTTTKSATATVQVH